MQFWIPHPACQDQPVPFHRWFAYRIGEFFSHMGAKLEWYGINPDDDIPF